jgi:ribonuclease HII
MGATSGRSAAPHLRVETELLRAGARRVAGMDEVGRGALAGPVSVGVVVVDLTTSRCPTGLADSKLLTAGARTALLPALGRWGLARAVGHASAAEIDEHGIVGALRLAGGRALAAVCVDEPVDAVLLDGSHDWLSRPLQGDIFADDGGGGMVDDGTWPEPHPTVRTLVKADQTCASVSAASVLAKCERDQMMVELALAYPGYDWASNKGYGSASHIAALSALGVSAVHRRSWNLPGIVPGFLGRPG